MASNNGNNYDQNHSTFFGQQGDNVSSPQHTSHPTQPTNVQAPSMVRMFPDQMGPSGIPGRMRAPARMIPPQQIGNRGRMEAPGRFRHPVGMQGYGSFVPSVRMEGPGRFGPPVSMINPGPRRMAANGRMGAPSPARMCAPTPARMRTAASARMSSSPQMSSSSHMSGSPQVSGSPEMSRSTQMSHSPQIPRPGVVCRGYLRPTAPPYQPASPHSVIMSPRMPPSPVSLMQRSPQYSDYSVSENHYNNSPDSDEQVYPNNDPSQNTGTSEPASGNTQSGGYFSIQRSGATEQCFPMGANEDQYQYDQQQHDHYFCSSDQNSTPSAKDDILNRIRQMSNARIQPGKPPKKPKREHLINPNNVPIVIRKAKYCPDLKIEKRNATKIEEFDGRKSVAELEHYLHETLDTVEFESNYFLYITVSNMPVSLVAEGIIAGKILLSEQMNSPLTVGMIYNKGIFQTTTIHGSGYKKFLVVLKFDLPRRMIDISEDNYQESESNNISARAHETVENSVQHENVLGGVEDKIYDVSSSNMTVTIRAEDKFEPTFEDPSENFEAVIEYLQTKLEEAASGPKVTIDRDHVMDSLLTEFKRIGTENLLNCDMIKPAFLHEPGVDYGGVRKEFAFVMIEEAIKSRVISDPTEEGSCFIPMPKNLEYIEPLMFFIGKLATMGVLIPVFNTVTLATMFDKYMPTSDAQWCSALMKFPAGCGKAKVNDMKVVMCNLVGDEPEGEEVIIVQEMMMESGMGHKLTEENKLEKIGALFKHEVTLHQKSYIEAAQKGLKMSKIQEIEQIHPSFMKVLSAEVRPFLVLSKEEVMGKLSYVGNDFLSDEAELAKEYFNRIIEDLEIGIPIQDSSEQLTLKELVRFITGGEDLLTVRKIEVSFTDDDYGAFGVSTCFKTIAIPTSMEFNIFRRVLLEKLEYIDSFTQA